MRGLTATTQAVKLRPVSGATSATAAPGPRPRTTWPLVTARSSASANADPTMPPFSTVAW